MNTIRRPLKVGIGITPYEQDSGHMPGWSELKSIGQHAEAAGFDSLWVPDHLLIDRGETGRPPCSTWECWSILSSLAAVTTRAEIGTIVACTSFRNPALLAKMADTVNEISGGRLILGLGAGYHELEFRAFGYPYDHLVGRFEEALQIIRGLLRDGHVDFHGQYYSARECELRPHGPLRPGPPLMIGAEPYRPRALRLMARYADYWNVFSVNRTEELVPRLEAVDMACAEAGRDPASLRRTVTLLVDIPGAPGGPSNGLWSRYFTSRSPAPSEPERLSALLQEYARMGVDHVQIFVSALSQTTIDRLAPTLEVLDRA